MLPTWIFTFKAKLIGLGILILALGWFYRRQIVKAEERGAARKSEQMLKDEGQRIDAEVAEKLAQYAQEREELQAQRNALVTARSALTKERGAISESLAIEIGKLSSKGTSIETDVRTIPASELDARIREALSRARAADAELAAIRAH